MKKENFKKAKPIMNEIDNIEKLLSSHKLGKNSNSEDFIENSDDFYQGAFFIIKNYNDIHSTGGGHSDVSRIKISEYRDGTGANYYLNKQETIKLQKFVSDMLNNRKSELMEKLNEI